MFVCAQPPSRRLNLGGDVSLAAPRGFQPTAVMQRTVIHLQTVALLDVSIFISLPFIKYKRVLS